MDNCGNSLSDYIKYIKKMKINNLNKTITIILECAKSIKILHDIDYVHLDIKPSNFLYDETRNTVKIIDFGFMLKNHTVIQDKRGTKLYMCYERHNSIIEANKFFDIFSLGCIIMDMIYYSFKNIILCPFVIGDNNENKEDLLDKLPTYRLKYSEEDLENDMIHLKKYMELNYKNTNEKKSKKIIECLTKMLEVNIKRRYKTIDLVINDLETILNF